MRIHRYTEWDGTQEVLFPTTDDLLKHLSDHLLEEEGVRRALRDLMRRGFTSEDGHRSVKGMRDFLREADEKRRECSINILPIPFKLTPEEQKALSDKLNGLAEKLEAYHEQMRNFMERMSGKFADRMDELNEKMREAYQRYQELRNRLQNQICRARHARQQNMSGQDPQSLMDMLDRMQKLLEDENFLKNLPSMMDNAVNNLDSMLENLDSMTQEQLQQLSDMMNQMQQLEQLMNQFGFQGAQRMGMGEAGQILSQLRGLERFLRWGQRGMGDPSELNLEELREILGDEAYEHLKYLKSVEQTLEDEGYILRTDHGLRLTPKGMRKIGDKALREIFQMLNKGRWGNHATSSRGSNGDRMEETKQYEYGDPLNVNIGETLLNALEKRKKGEPLRTRAGGFLRASGRVLDRQRNRAADRRELFDAHERCPARRQESRLGAASADPNQISPGHASLGRVSFQRQADSGGGSAVDRFADLLHGARHRYQRSSALCAPVAGLQSSANRQIILITDGEPTAATLDRGGRLHSGWGSALLHSRIVHETLKEVKRCTQSGIKINTFMLGADFYRQGFIDQLSRLNTGRVFYTTPDQMGNYIVVDYLNNKRKRIGRMTSNTHSILDFALKIRCRKLVTSSTPYHNRNPNQMSI